MFLAIIASKNGLKSPTAALTAATKFRRSCKLPPVSGHFTTYSACAIVSPPEPHPLTGKCIFVPRVQAVMLTLYSDDSFFRLIAQQDQEAAVARLRALREGMSETTTPTPRPPQRRSPPSEAENRRRTRVRHSSFQSGYPTGLYASATVNRPSTGASGTAQQSPTRERVMTPGNLLRPHSHAEGPDTLLTPYLARQFLPGTQRYFYGPFDPTISPNAILQNDQPMSNTNLAASGFRMSNTAPLQNFPSNSQPYYSNMPFGNAQPATFPQQLPPLSAPSFQNPPANHGTGVPSTGGAEGQMQ